MAESEAVIGHAKLTQPIALASHQHVLMLGCLAVDPHQQRAGAGRRHVEAIAAEARARGARKLLCGSWVAIRPPDGSTRRAASSPRHPESRVPARRKVRRRRPDGLLPDQGERATGLMKALLRDGLRLAVCSPSRVGEGSQQLGFPPRGKAGLAWPVKALCAFPGEQVDEHVLPPAVTQTRCDRCGSRPAGPAFPARLDQPHRQRVRTHVLGHALPQKPVGGGSDDRSLVPAHRA